MARAVKSRRTERQRKSKVQTEMPLNRTNYMIIIGGALLIIVTYILLATNNTVYGFIPLDLVPILLFIGYLVIVPIGIMYRGKKKVQGQAKTTPEATK
ncbi:MAG: hypothetical protein M1339_01155 [Bacteroidetes bacterium]|nr:hypothetical protein [Bacteroidota bacterium]